MLSFFRLDVLDVIWDLIESVSEGFLTYFVRMIIQTQSNTSICDNKFSFMVRIFIGMCVAFIACVEC